MVLTHVYRQSCAVCWHPQRQDGLNIMTQDTARLNAIRNLFLFCQSTEDHSIHQTWRRLGASQEKSRPSRGLGSAPCAKGHRCGEDRFQLLSGLQRAEVASGGK